MKLISERVTNTGQVLTLTRITDSGSHRYRTTIRRDTYDAQSYAKVEVWTDAGWSIAVYVPGEHDEVKAIPTGYAVNATKHKVLGASVLIYAHKLEDEALAVAE